MATTDVLINCFVCQAKVQLSVNGGKKDLWVDAEEGDRVTGGQKISVGACAVCQTLLVGLQKLTRYEDDVPNGPHEYWSDAERIWPDPESPLSSLIPATIRESLTESSICLNAGAYGASVLMSGRALEAIARHFTKQANPERVLLSRGLNELHANKVIDERLFAWGKELQEHRNLAAHPTGTKFAREDADDLLNFVVAICEYVFVVQEKYDVFIRRKENKKSSVKV